MESWDFLDFAMLWDGFVELVEKERPMAAT
jgi:hypothetical protein